MPWSWTEDSIRSKRARVSDGLVFKSKPELTLDFIARALEDEMPGKVALTDAGYGYSSE